MKKIYIAVAVFFAFSIMVFLGSFAYLDKEKHKTYHYVINVGGRDVGSVRIDSFDTDDKIICKAETETPFGLIYTASRARIDFDRKYNLERYVREEVAGNYTASMTIEATANTFSFLSKFDSEFLFADAAPLKHGTFVFEEDSPLTYLPLIANYDFRKGRSQGFNTLTCSPRPELPPMQRFVILTSIRDERVKIESRKIKTETLILRIKNYPQGTIWVAKSDRSLIRLELPDRKLIITRTFSPKEFAAQEPEYRSDAYSQKTVSFRGGGGKLAGTLSVPNRENPSPAVLFIGSEAPNNRSYRGLFASLADHLARSGICALRYDGRGTGESDGDAEAVTDAAATEDARAALAYLSALPETDRKRIFLLGHGRGALHSLRAAAANPDVRGVVVMAPQLFAVKDSAAEIRSLAAKHRWEDDYIRLVLKSIDDTIGQLSRNDKDWVQIIGRKCFLAAMRERALDDPSPSIRQTVVPVLILQGKEGQEALMESAAALDRMLADAGNARSRLTYFGYLGRFFGNIVDDGIRRAHYAVDAEVPENIRKWIDDVSGEPLTAAVTAKAPEAAAVADQE